MKKILHIEDDSVFARMSKVRLEEDGKYAVEYLETGIYAIGAVKKQNPDLILLDLQLPDKDGFQILREIKADKETSGIPVVILTKAELDKDMEKSMELKADAYLSKSQVTFSGCMVCIEDILKKR